MSTLDLVNYYSQLLILQYQGKPKAYATIAATVAPILMPQTSTQSITFSEVATSGVFVLSYNGNSSPTLNWNDSAATLQSQLRTLPGLASILVTGSIASQSLMITFDGVIPPAFLLILESSSLVAGSSLLTVTITETDVTLPLALQNAFNIIGDQPAVGVQLDILGKYIGATRNGIGISGPITLNDADYLSLLQFQIITNNSGSSLGTIQNSLFNFFGMAVVVYDYSDMHMSYFINSSDFVSTDLIQILISDNLLPKPMGVQISVIYVPVTTGFFGFRTYAQPAVTVKGFNTYQTYNMDWPWIDYSDAFVPLLTLGTEDGNTIVQENGSLIYLG